ncbi:MAG: thioredoxin fold domain-containing protein [Thiolinea sp.]
MAESIMKENYLNNILRTHWSSYALVLILSFACKSAVPDEERVLKEEHNFQDLGQLMDKSKQPVLVAFIANYCGYCRQLEKDYLKPMATNSSYTTRILIRTVDITGTQDLIDFNGNTLSPSDFAKNYQANITPTLVFLDKQGKEIAERLVGYNSPDYYGVDLDKSIEQAVQHTQRASEFTDPVTLKDKGKILLSTLPSN